MDRQERANPVLPKGAKLLLRILGVVNFTVTLLGFYWQIPLAHSLLTGYSDPTASASFRLVFGATVLVDLAFATVILVTAIWFIRCRLSAANPYALSVFVLLVYRAMIPHLCRLGGGLGISIAAALGIGNMGTALFEFLFVVPDLYPVVSVVLTLFLMQKYGTGFLPAHA